jgi:hypothetical protein
MIHSDVVIPLGTTRCRAVLNAENRDSESAEGNLVGGLTPPCTNKTKSLDRNRPLENEKPIWLVAVLMAVGLCRVSKRLFALYWARREMQGVNIPRIPKA